MRISQLAARSGVAASTLRYYDERGLLPARRTAAGYRVYDGVDLQRLGLITAAKRLGLPLDEIAELIETWRDGVCAQVKSSLRPRLAARLAAAQGRAADLATFTDTLRSTLDRLDALPDTQDPCGPDCRLPDHRPLLDDEAHSPVGRADEGESDIACSLDSAEMADRSEEWRAVLRGSRREEIPGGLRAVLPAERAPQAARLAAAEQRCCPFISFTLLFAYGSVSLEVRAPAEARPMLGDVFGAAGDGGGWREGEAV
ncbi:MerR family transcriptional regulator [Streptomonospora litoralis]|uniref:HTH-type transcriptional regulator HmrR n=1 Tax=Streptomonospora litoralis TaxID=2498135 RepID=A0A4P6Q2Q7_9ACTN|nr:MerR family transcriptional regulator [Streptomonospora litoralis]QBI53159.1 HTH-type transcriptional regulator HmrR [Streptomonospora litoralis]